MGQRAGRIDHENASAGDVLIADESGHFAPSGVQDLSPSVRIDGTKGHLGFKPKNSATLAIAVGAGAGVTPPAPTLLAGSSDSGGEVNMGTGTSPAAGIQATVSFAAAFTIAPIVVLSSQNAATAALRPYVANKTTAGFDVAFGVAGAASQATGTYEVDYVVIGCPN